MEFRATIIGAAHLPPPAATHAPGRSPVTTFRSASGDCRMSCTAQNRAASAAGPISASSAGACTTVTLSQPDRKSTRLNSSHVEISYAVFCLKKKKNKQLQLNQN